MEFLRVTDQARRRLAELRRACPTGWLYVGLVFGGCHGFQTRFEWRQNGQPVPAEGYASDAASLPHIRNSTLDWTSDLQGARFVLRNVPHSSQSCSCGSSFDLADPTS